MNLKYNHLHVFAREKIQILYNTDQRNIFRVAKHDISLELFIT